MTYSGLMISMTSLDFCPQAFSAGLGKDPDAGLRLSASSLESLLLRYIFVFLISLYLAIAGVGDKENFCKERN